MGHPESVPDTSGQGAHNCCCGSFWIENDAVVVPLRYPTTIEIHDLICGHLMLECHNKYMLTDSST
jgi:hypothetical protein